MGIDDETGAGFNGRMLFLTPTKLKLGMWLGASVAFAFNNLAQVPVTSVNVTSAGDRIRAARTPSPTL